MRPVSVMMARLAPWACVGVFLVAGVFAVSPTGASAVRSPGVRHTRSARRKHLAGSTHSRSHRPSRQRHKHGHVIAHRLHERSTAVGSLSLLGGPLVVSGSPVEAEQLHAQETATLTSPEAVNLQAASETAYEGLDAEQAEKADTEAFPVVFDEPAGGPPRLGAGEQFAGFVGAFSARVELGSGPGAESGVIESTVPMAVEDGAGGWAPVDLSLRDVGGAFEPVSPLVGVRLPKRLSEGALIPSIGLSVVPVGGSGVASGGLEGRVSGVGALFANSMTDSDTVMKPSTFGFLVDTSLRSVKSPDEISYEVGLPAGASLVGESGGSVSVVREGATIARMVAPVVHDAAGRLAPVAVSVAGNKITLTVNHATGAYRYPLEVDPEFNVGLDTTVSERNWLSNHVGWFSFGSYNNEMAIDYSGSWDEGEWGSLDYQTHGHSKIYEVNASTSFEPSACCNIEGKLYTQDEGSISDTLEIHSSGNSSETPAVVVSAPTSEWPIKTRLCPKSECVSASGSENNAVTLKSTIINGSNPAKAEHITASDTLKSASVGVSQPSEIHSTVSFNTTSKELDKTVNVLDGGGEWMSTHQGAFEYTGHDTGVGIDALNLERFNGAFETFYSKSFLETSSCSGIQCAAEQKETLAYESPLFNPQTGTHNLSYYLKEGENRIRISPRDAIAHTAAGEHGEGEIVLKVDNQAPTKLSVSGLSTKGEVFQLGESAKTITVSATDGEPKLGEAVHASSGVKSIALAVDGKEVGSPHGSCSPGECTASGEWSLSGAELGTGLHTLTVAATDDAGNIATKEFYLEVFSAAPLPMGPGSVNPESGDFALETADVNLSGGMGDLTVTRHYDSRNTREGAGGPLGPQWSIGLGSLASLEVLPDGSVMVVGPSGLTHFTKAANGGFEAPTGDKTLTLTRHTVTFEELVKGKHEEYLLADPTKGTTTRFTLPAGSSMWLPTVSEGLVASDTVSDEYATAEPESGKRIVEPILEVAPHPSATCAYKKLEKGCRALEFNYAASTTATEGKWGDYKGDLTRVYAIAWNPAKSEMSTVTVAQYAYDTQGRLRAEWDPRISPALKTIYGYDSEGHVSAITPAGRESTAFVYGTVSPDANGGRLLKVRQAPASMPLWVEGSSSPANTKAPEVTGTPMMGGRLAVSNGSWSGEPVVYGYQWEDCNTATSECTVIPGAVNANYTPVSSDIGYALVARVSAINGAGTVVAESAQTNPVVAGGAQITVGYSSEFGSWGTGSGQFREPADLKTGSSGEVWVADSQNHRVDEFSAEGSFIRSFGSQGTGPGQFESTVMSVAVWKGDVWAANTDEINEYTKEGTFVRSVGSAGSGNGQFNGIEGMAVNSKGVLYVADNGNHRIEEFGAEEGNYIGSVTKVGEKEGPSGLALDAAGDIYVSISWEARIEEFSPEGVLMRSFGTHGSKPGQLSSPERLTVGPEGNLWVAEFENSRVQVFKPTGEFVFGFGGAGEGNSQFLHVRGVSFYGQNLYVLDSAPWNWNSVHERVQKWSLQQPETPAYTSEFGSWGTESGQFREPADLQTDSSGDVWVADSQNHRVDEFSPEGKFVRSVGSLGTGPGYFEGTVMSIAVSKGDVWAANTNSVNEYTTAGMFVRSFGSAGSGNGQFNGVEGMAVDSKGTLYVADSGNHRIQEFDPQGHYIKSITNVGEKEGPSGLALDANGNIVVSIGLKPLIEEFSPEGVLLRSFGTGGSSPGQLALPERIAVGPEGNIWTAEFGNSRVQVFRPTGEYLFGFGGPGEGNSQLLRARGIAFYGPYVYVLDSATWSLNTVHERVQKWHLGEEAQQQAPQPGTTIEYNVPVTGQGAPHEMTSSELEKWGEKEQPVQAAAVFPPDEPQTWPASKYTRAAIDYMNAEARTVNTAEPGGGIGTTEYGPSGEVQTTLSAANRQQALNEGGNTALNAYRLSTTNVYEQESTRLTSTIGPLHTVKIVKGNTKVPSGSEIQAHNRVYYYYDENAPATGETYDLVTKTVDEAESLSGEHFDPRTSTTSYSGQNNLGWKLRTPTSAVTDPEGLKITHTTMFDETTGNVVETQGPASTGQGNTHDSVSVYYTAEANTKYPECGGHNEWVGLPCEALPGKQPETGPQLPVKTITYNIWDEPEIVTETFGTTTRTRKTTFDEAGRALTSEVTSSTDTPVPAITDHYDETTGALIKESETVEGKEVSITSASNTIGQPTSYTDASGNTTTFEYEPEKDRRLTKVTDSKGSQTYSYDETSGQLTKLVDSAAGTFTASYDAFGQMISETYPNKMTAYYTRNSVGDTTSIEYKKNAHCATSCPEVWFNDTIVLSIHGEQLKQTSSLSEEPKYVYDEAGRLTEVQEIPVGKGCVTRLYAYDIESNRTGLTSREPGSEGKCASEGGTTENHTYDQANRLTDTGVTYEAFGDTTKVPAADAGGSEITSSFYVDGQLATQEQNETTTGYTYDPSGRTLATKSKNKTSSTISFPHYAGVGSAITWTCEEAESSKECEEEKATKWTRNIPGIDGTLTATQTSSGVTTLLLHDLQGNVVAEAALSETETKLLKTYNSTEFGVPQSGSTPPKYSWLGASGVASESSTGTIVKDGITYVPQTGRPLQTQSTTVPIPQNAAKEYTDALEPWVAEQDAAAAAQQVVNAEQARRAIEEANKPPGVLPGLNPSEWCGGQYGPCEEEESDCSGTSACAASANPHHHPGVIEYHEHGNGYAGCSVWASYGSQHMLSGISGEIEIFGHWKCKEAVPMFEIQTALLVY